MDFLLHEMAKMKYLEHLFWPARQKHQISIELARGGTSLFYLFPVAPLADLVLLPPLDLINSDWHR